ncbi:MAG: YfhO family protein, partial [Verrucomicrobia bacterium]|nr:YfhO family protein [Verrucomicrobiota bacterium]
GGAPPFYYRQYYEYWAKLAEAWAQTALDDVWLGPRFRQIHADIPGDPVFRGARLMFYPTEYAPEIEIANLYHMNMMSLANVAYIVSRDRLLSPTLKEVRGRKIPWSGLSRAERARENVRGNFRGLEDLYVYRNTQVVPRFFAVSSVQAFDDTKQLLDAISASSVDQLRTQLFVKKTVIPKELEGADSLGIAKIKLDAYTSDEIRLTVKSDKPSVLIISNAYSPFWKARIDERDAQIFPAYHAFWGLYVPAGSKQIVFHYEPPYT